MVTPVTSESFKKEVLEEQLPVVVDVYAQWCGPCQMMTPVFEELSETLEGTYKFVKLDLDESRDLAITYGVASIPTFLFFKQGALVGSIVGYKTKEELHGEITRHFSS
jgi:thioredoxin 1